MASENDKVAPAHTEPCSPLWLKIALVVGSRKNRRRVPGDR
ncbi:hypothetical protein [Tessaracoccus flavescens]|nr:hypothetical protein [Tessaracoccus flavescens]